MSVPLKVLGLDRFLCDRSTRFLDLKAEYEKRKIVPEFMKTNPMYFV